MPPSGHGNKVLSDEAQGAGAGAGVLIYALVPCEEGNKMGLSLCFSLFYSDFTAHPGGMYGRNAWCTMC